MVLMVSGHLSLIFGVIMGTYIPFFISLFVIDDHLSLLENTPCFLNHGTYDMFVARFAIDNGLLREILGGIENHQFFRSSHGIGDDPLQVTTVGS